ncbi:dihydropyrimidinase [Alcaligenaceae bacterium CGII-47]|nr:dihydropyrimidinase [Alcaligenaceae bacterium CGII-47]
MSSKFDLIITHADVVTASDRFTCDIGIRAGKIAALGHDLGSATETVDATGLLVLPGGVDAHCHLDQPMGFGLRMADDFRSGSRSAACGGTTTIIPFAAQAKGQSLRAAVEDYHQRAQGQSAVDYAFHLIVSDPTQHVLDVELPELISEGYTSFKVYMTYDDLKLNDRQILDVLDVARRTGALVMVHAESTDCIAWLTQRLDAAGHTAPKYHAAARPELVEREATHRAITFAELVDVPILIVHVSGQEAIEQIRWAQGRGQKIFAETCPQYLYLTAEDLDQDGYEGAKCVCSPPPRDAQNQEAVWRALAGNVFSVFSSDHAPFSYEDPQGKKLNGKEQKFQHIPNGIPGLETRLPLLFSGGVVGGRINIHQFVALTSTQPAKLYGLYPRKGSIMVGADADLVLWDPAREVTIRNERLHHNVDYTPYEGTTVRGWPMMTFSRGRLISKDFGFVGTEGAGEFMPCGKPIGSI